MAVKKDQSGWMVKMRNLIEVSGATFAYENRIIFQELSFTIFPGEIFCLLGPNGCGKTTLLDAVLGFNRLKQGSIKIEGKSLNSMSPGEIATHLSYVPQRHDRTFPYTVLDIVKMGRTAYTGRFSAPGEEDIEIARQALKKVGMLALENKPYTRLSGGESQLVMIARALAQKTPVIVMDEPTSHLDFKNEYLILKTITDLVKESGVSIVTATHFPNHAFYFENQQVPVRVALMHQQQFMQVGPATQVLSENSMREMYHMKTKLVSIEVDDHDIWRQLVPLRMI